MKNEVLKESTRAEHPSILKRLYKTALIPYPRIKVLYDRKILLPQIAKRIAAIYDSPQTVLDIGSGRGYFGEALQQALPNTAHIISTDVTKTHQGKTPCVVSTGYQLPFRDGTFDVSTLSSVLHHTNRPRAVLEETKRVSKKIVVQEDTYRKRWQRWLINDHVKEYQAAFPSTGETIYTDAEWQQLFGQAGLEVVKKRRIRRLGYPVPRYEYHLKPINDSH